MAIIYFKTEIQTQIQFNYFFLKNVFDVTQSTQVCTYLRHHSVYIITCIENDQSILKG